MPTVTIPKLTEETLRALKQRATMHGRDTEAEIRQILDDAVRSDSDLKIGTELAAFGKKHGGIDLETARDQSVTACD